MKNSALLITTLVIITSLHSAAWGQSRIERDNADSIPTAQPQTRTGDDGSGTSGTTPPASGPRFVCEQISGQLTVVYRPLSRPQEAYPWAIPSDMGTAWNSQRRCSEIARRLESYRADGLQELRTGIENRQNVVCVTTEKNQSCRIVFTVPSRQDPIATRDQVFRNLSLADSGQQTQGVNTFTGSNDNILDSLDSRLGSSRQTTVRSNRRGSGLDLRPFLSSEDGGDGSRMGNPVQVPANYRLNPDNFR